MPLWSTTLIMLCPIFLIICTQITDTKLKIYCNQQQAQMVQFRDLCEKAVVGGNQKLANHTKKLHKEWSHAIQRQVDLEQIGMNLTKDKLTYHHVGQNRTWMDINQAKIEKRLKNQES